MNSSLTRSVRPLALTLLLGAALAGCATNTTTPQTPGLIQQIQSASTKADHEAIAVSYLAKAAAARAEAEQHRRMAALYKTQPAVNRGGNMSDHCDSVVKKYEDIAQDYEKLAAEHRQMRDHAAR